MELEATPKQVGINSIEPGAYNLVGNKRILAPQLDQFDDFLLDSYAQHGPTVGRSALSIIPDDLLTTTGDSISQLSTPSKGISISNALTGSSLSNNASTFNTNEFDLRTLKHQCLLDITDLLNKCFCIWHRPTRESVPRSERLHAYQLVLLKLRKHTPFVTFRDARSIVRQMIRSYVCKQRLGEGDNASRRSHADEGTNDRLEVDQLATIKSKAILNRLSFLQGCDESDVEELVPDKRCAFCNFGFHNTETLWTHMVSAHLPTRTQQSSGCITIDTVTTDSKMKRLSSSRKRTHKRTSRFTFDNGTASTQQSDSGLEPSCVRRSRQKRRSTCPTGQHARGKKKVGQQCHRRRSKSSGEDTSVDSRVFDLYLCDYSDKFLEEFIDLYRQQECLWRRNLGTYHKRKLKEASYDVLLKKYCQSRKVSSVSINKIKLLIRRMRSYYNRLKNPNANQFRSHIWKRLSFIDQGRTTPKRKRSRSNDTGNTDYECSTCRRKFKIAKSYAAHMLKMHPPTECPTCREKFNNADELVHHLFFQHHKDADCPLCKEGKDIWKSSTHLKKHFFEHHCTTCTSIFRDVNNLRRHRPKCRKINRLRCRQCTSKFTSTLDFRRHAKAMHQDNQPFKCDHCETSFKCLAPWTRHRKVHKQPKNYHSS
ncbi:zinc finger protein 341-like [Anastrepha ludens]|uniref:zinc finger protein 341-like n=1 Tax=Anastrepha ludens TaxID=28586 RepID=UPI0023AED78B|nr:zinc finger protein 341-like [Anastrepha ludens]